MYRAVRVQYTARPEYVETNKQNISKVMAELKAINNPGIKYSTFLDADGKSFMHFAMFENEAATQVLNNLESFKYFSNALKESGPEVPVKVEQLSLVASGYDIF